MVAIALNNNTIKTALLAHIADQINRGNYDCFLAAGLSPNVLDEVRLMRLDTIARLIDLKTPEIMFDINVHELQAGLKKLKQEDVILNDLLYFIRNGATKSLAIQLFSCDLDQEIIHCNYRLLNGKSKRGRTCMPDTKTRDLIHKYWHNLSDKRDQLSDSFARTGLIALHKQFNQMSIDSLHATINEFED